MDNMNNQVSDERGRIPDLIKIGSIPSDLQVEVDTDVLDPVVANDKFCRFVLSNKGFLHSFSKIVLAVNSAGAEQTGFPANVGIHSLIERCALKIGTKTIAEIEDFAHWMSYKSMFIENDINHYRETFITNRVMAHEFNYTVRDIDGGIAQNDTEAQNLYIKGQREPQFSASFIYDSANAVADAEIANVALLKQLELNGKTNNEPEFSISVADLFPFLRFNQLPLYMIDQQVSIELHFTANGAKNLRTVVPETAITDSSQTILTSALQFVADYIYYDGDLMEQYRNANKMMTWSYIDYRLNKRTIPRANLGQKTIINVGGAGRVVSKCICGLADDSTPDPDVSNMNIYSAKIGDATNASNNNQPMITNLRYNDNYLYPLDRENPAVHFNDVIQGEGNVPHVNRMEYSGEGLGFVNMLAGNTAGDIRYQDQPAGDPVFGVANNFFWNVYRLNRNERINSRGIEIEVNYSDSVAFDDRPHTHRTYLEIMRSATLNDGFFELDYA
jgi:hypothetical protein